MNKALVLTTSGCLLSLIIFAAPANGHPVGAKKVGSDTAHLTSHGTRIEASTYFDPQAFSNVTFRVTNENGKIVKTLKRNETSRFVLPPDCKITATGDINGQGNALGVVSVTHNTDNSLTIVFGSGDGKVTCPVTLRKPAVNVSHPAE